MTKTFTQAPKPRPLSLETIAAFERGGAGQDTLVVQNVGIREPTPVSKPKEKLRRLSVDLPENLHRRFKTACTRADTTMLDEVAGFIWKRTEELERS